MPVYAAYLFYGEMLCPSSAKDTEHKSLFIFTSVYETYFSNNYSLGLRFFPYSPIIINTYYTILHVMEIIFTGQFKSYFITD